MLHNHNKIKKMATKIFSRGTEINKVNVFDIEESLELIGYSAYEAVINLGDGESDYIYVSNGFLTGLAKAMRNEIEPNEWHHYFKKDEDGCFEAFKCDFN